MVKGCPATVRETPQNNAVVCEKCLTASCWPISAFFSRTGVGGFFRTRSQNMNSIEQFIADSLDMIALADRRVTWQRDKPHCVGIWFGAKWQESGYYHVQRYRFDYRNTDLMDEYNDDYWFGPLTEEQAKERWTHFICGPKHLTRSPECGP